MSGRKDNGRDANGDEAPAAAQLRPSLHPTYARLLAAELKRRGFSDDDIFGGTRLSWSQLLEEDRFVSFEQFRQLARRGIDLSGEGWLGLDVGRSTQISSHGRLGYAMVASPDVGHALDLAERYSSLRLQIAGFAVERGGGRVRLRIDDTVGWGDIGEYISLHIVGAICLLLETVSGMPLPDTRIAFTYPTPAWASEYRRRAPFFAAQIGIDRVLEIDVNGNDAPRLVAKRIGNLNSFEITSDDVLFGPLAGIGTLARIDIDSGVVTPVAENLGMLSAVNLDSRGRIYAVGWSSGELLRIDVETGTAEVIAELDPPLDNLAIAADDRIYLSQPSRGGIVRVDPDTGEQTDIVAGNMSVPGGLAITTEQGREMLIMADDFAFRWVDTQTGEVSASVDLAEFMDPAAATDVAINDEVIVLSDVSRSRVYMLDRNTSEKLQQWKGIGAPYGLVLLDSGDPIVADYESGQLIQLSRTDRKSREVVAEGLSGPVGMTLAGADALYVTEATAGRVSRINIADGSKVTVSEGLNQPEGLTVLPDGRLAVVEVGTQRVIAINPETGVIEVLAEDLPVGQFVPEAPAPVHVPSGIAVGANGVLYLTSDRDHSVLKLVPQS